MVNQHPESYRAGRSIGVKRRGIQFRIKCRRQLYYYYFLTKLELASQVLNSDLLYR